MILLLAIMGFDFDTDNTEEEAARCTLDEFLMVDNNFVMNSIT